MPTLPSDNYSKEELANIINAFGGVEQYQIHFRAWLWNEVRQREFFKRIDEEEKKFEKKFPDAAKNGKKSGFPPMTPAPAPVIPPPDGIEVLQPSEVA